MGKKGLYTNISILLMKTEITKNQQPISKIIIKGKDSNSKIVVEATKIIGSKRFVYRKLDNGLQFGGELDKQQNGKDGIIVNYEDQYYLKGCQIKDSFLVNYKSKHNLISHEIITERYPQTQNMITLEQLCQNLYKQYLEKEIQHKILVFFTNQTEQFIKNSRPIQDYQRFRQSYSQYTQIFLMIKDSISYAFVINKDDVYFLQNQNTKNSSEAISNTLKHLVSVGYKKQQYTCPTHNRVSSKQKNLNLDGCFIIPLLVNSFSKNTIKRKCLLKLQASLHRIFSCKNYYVSDLVNQMLRSKVLTQSFQKLLDRLDKILSLQQNKLKVNY